MASVGLRCGGGVRKALLSPLNVNVNANDQQHRQRRRSFSCRRQLPQAMLISNSDQPQINFTEKAWNLSLYREESSGFEKGEISSETLDVWMRDSVTEIVKKIGEAPFLVHVFSSKKNGKTKVTQLNIEKAVAEEWACIKRRWEERGELSTPDGIILVEEMKDENEEDGGGRRSGGESSTRAWGIVVQGRGLNCFPACYILKTSRVGSPSIGFCTHFCLLKAQLSSETALQQMKNAWLLHPQFLDQHSYFSDL